MSTDSASVDRREIAIQNDDLASNVKQMFQPRILMAILTIIGAVVFGSGLIIWAMKSDYVPVVGGLSQADTARVVDYLNSTNQPFSLDANSGLVLVPAAKARLLKIELAGIGIQEKRGSQPEMLSQNQPLGTSQFIEQARYQHSLEEQLSRTVASLRNVDTARIHLALPKRSTFVRKQALASASVMVKMMAGRSLEKEQVRAIKNMVSSSVPYLESGRVTVVDEWGALLSGGDNMSEVSDSQFEYARKLENHYVQRIQELLVPLVGPDRMRASVAADVDFSYEEETQETFEPDSAQVRSEQDQRRRAAGGNANGVPGAATNQPPEPEPADGEAGDRALKGDDISLNLTRNYELDKKISHFRNAPGKVIRLSAAVVLDTAEDKANDATDPQGNEEVADEQANAAAEAEAAAELELYTALVKEAIGFNEDRGDSVIVFSKPFQPPVAMEPPPAASIWEKPMIWTIARQLVSALIVLLIALLIVRPALLSLQPQKNEKVLLTQDAESGATGIEGENISISPGALEHSGNSAVKEAHGDILLMARTMARDNPKRVAMVVKDWVEAGGESGG